MKEVDRNEAYENSLKLLYNCSTPNGFVASSEENYNYKRVWGRDSMICSLGALMTKDKNLISQVKKSLLTLIKFQHKQGQIPSNVEVSTKKISYGMSTGRIDATLWFLIVFSQYIKRTSDISFLKKYYENIKRALSICHLYEFNDRGFIYVPKGGDWADEYIQEGYVLYDQLLYYKAIEEFIYLRKKLNKEIKDYGKRLDNLKNRILVNFWFDKGNKNSSYVYHRILFERYSGKKKYQKDYLLPYFNPSGYGFRFDGMGNSLALLFDIVGDKKEKKIRDYIQNNFSKSSKYLLPAFYPPITSKDIEWGELKCSYSSKFKNKPNQYHNGGLWPVVTGFYVASLKDKEIAGKYLDGINNANFPNGEFIFPEFINSKTFKSGGHKKMAWSGVASIIGFNHLKGRRVFV